MWHNLAQLLRYRGLIESMVARDLKARYRGSVLGFFWSFINPLLLLLIYSFVFTKMLPRAIDPNHPDALNPYAVFLFCGLLPWTWFSSALLESAGSLIFNGNLLKKVLFPAEVLPLVSVFSTMCHFIFGLPIFKVLIGKKHGESLAVAAEPDDIFFHFNLWGAVKPFVEEAGALLCCGGIDIVLVLIKRRGCRS